MELPWRLEGYAAWFLDDVKLRGFPCWVWISLGKEMESDGRQGSRAQRKTRFYQLSEESATFGATLEQLVKPESCVALCLVRGRVRGATRADNSAPKGECEIITI